MRQAHLLNNGIYRLSACLAVIAVIWLGMLPLASQHSMIDAHIRRNERLGIDPSAKFYTELPAMPELFERVQHRRTNNSTF